MVLLRKVLVVSIVCCASLALGEQVSEGRLMRFPDIYKDKIVFMYGGDLWLASSSGGVARRITLIPGANCSPSSRPTANGSPSPGNTTAISTST